MSNRTAALIGAAFILAAGGWIAHLYGKLELQEARYETRIAVLAEEVSQKDKARAEAVAAAERAARERLEKETARVAALSAELSDARKKLAKECQNFDVRLQKVASAARRNCAACLLVGCASTTKPLDLPPVPVVAPEVKAPIPPELLKMPDRPEPLAPGYAATH